MSVCSSAWKNSAPTGRVFRKFNISKFFLNSVEKIQFSLKSDKSNWQFTLKPLYTCTSFSMNSSQNKKLFRQNLQRKSKNTQLYSITCRKSCLLCDKVEKYSRAREATDDNIAHGHCIMDNSHTYIIYNIYSTATMVA